MCWLLFAPACGTRTPRKAAAVAVSYVQLVYGRQLQQPVDEQPIQDRLDVSAMTRGSGVTH